MSNLRTSIKDIPLANDRIISEVAKTHFNTTDHESVKVGQTNVRNIMNFVGHYIAGVIREGSMETVMLPGFGKFEPKPMKIRAYQKAARDKRNGKEIISKALRGKRKLTPPKDEAI